MPWSAGVALAFFGIANGEVAALLVSFVVNAISTIPWSLIQVYSAELFPSTMRGTGVGAVYAVSSLAGIAAPLGDDLFLPISLFAACMSYAAVWVFGGLVALGLPETKDQGAY